MQPPERPTTTFRSRNRPVLLVGASIRAAAVSAEYGGYQVFGADQFLDQETRRACVQCWTLDELSVTSDSELHNLMPHDARIYVAGGLSGGRNVLDRLHQIVGNSARQPVATAEFSDPRSLRRLAENAGVGFPESIANDFEETLVMDGRWLAKPLVGCAGLGIRWIDPASHKFSECYLQRWIPGRAFGAVLLVDGRGGSVLLGVSRILFTRVGDQPFVYAGSYGPVHVSERVVAQLVSIAQHFQQGTLFAGLLNIDFLLDDSNRFWLMEMNPRWSGSTEVLELAYSRQSWFRECAGGSMFRLWDRASQSDFCGLSTARIRDSLRGVPAIYKRVVFSRRSGYFDPKRLAGIRDDQWKCVDTPTRGLDVTRHEPLVTLLGEIPEGERLSWRKARRLIATVQDAVVSTAF